MNSSKRQETRNIGGISYLEDVYTGVGGWGKLRAQTRAEAKDAEMKISDEQKWVVNPTNITPKPLSSPVHWRALNRAGGMPSGTNPQLNW